MKKLLLIAVLVLNVGACTTLQNIGDTISAVTTGVANPITKDRLNTVENGAIVAFAGLNAYKRSCVARAIPSSCRTIIKNMQVYTRKIPQQLTNLRQFVANNDQVNAVIAYNAITKALTDFNAVAVANNVPLQQVQ